VTGFAGCLEIQVAAYNNCGTEWLIGIRLQAAAAAAFLPEYPHRLQEQSTLILKAQVRYSVHPRTGQKANRVVDVQLYSFFNLGARCGGE
jgi:hypothetical protein